MTTDKAILIKRIRELNTPLMPAPADIFPCCKRMTGLRAVLCDVYGTLLVSRAGGLADNYGPDRPAALRAALQSVGWNVDMTTAVDGVNLFDAVLASEHARLHAGGIKHPEVDVRVIWKKTLAGLPCGSTLALTKNDKLIARLAVEYESRINPVWPMPDMEETFSRLASAGLALGIVSNAQFYTPLTLTALLGEEWKSWFPSSLCFWSYEYKEAKPGLGLYRRALAALNESFGISPQETVMLGNDVENDLRPALACGCRAVLFAGDGRGCRLGIEDRRQVASWPWSTITNWSQLAEMLGAGR